MKIKIRNESLAGMVGMIGGICEKSASRPVFGRIHLRAADGRLYLSMCDDEISARLATPEGCDCVRENGHFCVPPGKFLEILKAIGGGNTAVSLGKDNRALIASGGSRFRLGTFPGEDFAGDKGLSGDMGDGAKASAANVDAAIRSVIPSGGGESSGFDGVNLEFGKDMITAVATDGNRLAVAPIKCEGLAAANIFLTRRGASALASVCAGHGSGMVALIPRDHGLALSSENVRMIIRSQPRDFPDWRSVVPPEDTPSLSVPAGEFADAIASARIMGGASPVALLKRDGDTLIVAAEDAATGDANITVGGVWGEAAPDVALDLRYLSDAITAARPAGGILKIGFGGGLKPLSFRSSDSPGAPFAVMMPLKTMVG